MSSLLPGDPQGSKKPKTEPFGEFMKTMNDFFQEKPVRGFLQTIDDFFRTPFPSPSFHVETIETGKEIIITAELPGVKKEQIQIDIRGNYLDISVNQSELILEEDETNQTYRRKQFRQHSSRTIPLPQPVNEKKIKASYRDGLLQIRLPREKGKNVIIEE